MAAKRRAEEKTAKDHSHEVGTTGFYTFVLFPIKYTFDLLIKSRILRWTGHVPRMEEGSSAFKIFTGTPAGKGPLGLPRRRWEDNIRIDLKEIDINTRN